MNKFLFLSLFFICSSAAAFAQMNIRQVDFNNFTYEPTCTGNESDEPYGKITVKNGKIDNIKTIDGVDEPINDNLPNYFEISDIIYGDLNSDGGQEAVITSFCNTGGTGQFSEGYIYTLKDGKPVLMTRIGGGDRGFGGLVKIKIVKGLLVVEQNDPQDGANCCAVFTLTTKYKLNDRKLVQVDKTLRRKIKSP